MLTHPPSAVKAPARLVILGAGGFVGKAVTAEAARRSISILPLSSAQIDLTQPQAVAALIALFQPEDSVIFAAAIDKGSRSTSADIIQNILMAHHVAQAIRETPIAHLTYLSSESIYGDRSGRIRESTPAMPTTLYGAMHQIREIMLARETTVPLAVLRLTGLYGAGDTHNAYGPNRFIRQALGEKNIALFGEGEEYRDHLHIRDAAAMILQTALLQLTGLLNIASGCSISFHDLAQQIAAITSAQITHAPRRQPILHRHLDPTERLMAFPGITPVSLSSQLENLCREFTAERAANV